MLDRMQARDAAYNGIFITGVLSTGIYCLPSCRARNPKPENVRFFPSPAGAREFGLRACKRCRPDDFYRQHDPDLEAVETLVAALRHQPGDFAGVASLAQASRLGTSKLHDLLRRHFHATPARLLARARIARTRRELIAGESTISDLAFAAGYESLSSFNANFRRATGMSPSEYRRLRGVRDFQFALPRSLPLSRSLAFLDRDPVSLTERVRDDRFEAGLWLAGKPARLEVDLQPGRAKCRILSRSRLPADGAAQAHDYLQRRLGLDTDPAPFERQIRTNAELAPLLADRRGLRIPRLGETFECLIWTIVGQQISLPFARTLFRRLVEKTGRPVGGGLFTPPQPRAVAALSATELTAVQFSARKAEYLLAVAHQISQGSLSLDALATGSATRAERELLSIRGLGPWSVHYLMMRGFGFADCVPVGDAGLVRALMHFFGLPERPSPSQTLALMEPFRPYRTLATFHLWTSLEDNS